MKEWLPSLPDKYVRIFGKANKEYYKYTIIIDKIELLKDQLQKPDI